MTTRFRLQFEPAHILSIARQYNYPGEPEILRDVATPARARGWFTYEEFVRLYRWKTRGRRIALLERQPPAEIEAATRVALDQSTREARRLGVLVALEGVGYPAASCVLHFAHREPYPILDVRALETLGYQTQRTVYSETFWQNYVAECRQLARAHGVSMRDLDRALWTWPGLPPAERAAYRAAR